MTKDTLRHNLLPSLTSANLLLSLASKLETLLPLDGYQTFSLKWKPLGTLSLRPYCQLAASALRTEGKDYSSGPLTYNAPTDYSGLETGTASFNIANWPTCSARDGKGGYTGGRIRAGKISLDTLDVVAQLTDWKNKPEIACHALPVLRVTTSGEILTGYSAKMDVSGQLNPEHSRWLMGFPAEWAYLKDTAMP